VVAYQISSKIVTLVFEL